VGSWIRVAAIILLLGGLEDIAGALGMAGPARATQAVGAGSTAVTGRVYRSQLPGRDVNEALLGVAVGADGTVWISDQADEALIGIEPGGRRRYVSLGAGALGNIENRASDVWTVGAVYVAPDGSIYVGERGALARVTDRGVRTFRIAAGRYASPGAITSGPDGKIWFTEVNRSYIGRFDPVSGKITQFRDGTGARGIPAGGITSGPDGRLWYTLPSYYRYKHGELGAISTHGKAAVYNPAADGLLQAAFGIVADQGSLWVLGSRLGAAPKGQPQSALLRVTPADARGPSIMRIGPGLGDAVGDLALARGGLLYAVGGALGASGNIVSVSETGVVRRYGHGNGQVSLFGAGANLVPLAAARDGSVWLGADDGVLEHLLPYAAAPCVVPQIMGYQLPAATARLRRGRCLARVGPVTGPRDTPAIVTQEGSRPGTVLNPGSEVKLTAKRGVPYACDPTGNSDPDLTVLRISCAAALHLYHLVYRRAISRGTASAEGFSCRYHKNTAIQGMGGGEVTCRAQDRHGRPRVDDMFYAPPR
jgi:virginiamycin B lyase